MAALTLYDYWRSSAAYRVRIALALKGLAYDAVPVNLLPGHEEQLNPDYAVLNPQQRVPVLAIAQGELTQSLAIIVWLDDTHPEPPLMPADPWMRAKARAFGLAIACDIHPLNNTSTQRELKRRFNADAEQLADWGRHWVGARFTALEVLVAREPTSTFAFGDTPSLADICLIPQLYNARRIGIDTKSYPSLDRIDRAAQTHPAFIAAAPERQPDAVT